MATSARKPKAANPQAKVGPGAIAVPDPTLPVLTAAEVQAAKLACVEFQQTYRRSKTAERDRDAAIAQLLFKMGLTSDKVRSWSPQRLAREIAERAGVTFEFENDDATLFAFLKTWEGRSISYKEELISRVGPAAVAEIEAGGGSLYSYAIIDRPQTEAPNVVFLPARKGATR